MSNKKKAELMSESAFREAVVPMLEQAYKQGFEDGVASTQATPEEPATWSLVDE